MSDTQWAKWPNNQLTGRPPAYPNPSSALPYTRPPISYFVSELEIAEILDGIGFSPDLQTAIKAHLRDSEFIRDSNIKHGVERYSPEAPVHPTLYFAARGIDCSKEIKDKSSEDGRLPFTTQEFVHALETAMNTHNYTPGIINNTISTILAKSGLHFPPQPFTHEQNAAPQANKHKLGPVAKLGLAIAGFVTAGAALFGGVSTLAAHNAPNAPPPPPDKSNSAEVIPATIIVTPKGTINAAVDGITTEITPTDIPTGVLAALEEIERTHAGRDDSESPLRVVISVRNGGVTTSPEKLLEAVSKISAKYMKGVTGVELDTLASPPTPEQAAKLREVADRLEVQDFRALATTPERSNCFATFPAPNTPPPPLSGGTPKCSR